MDTKTLAARGQAIKAADVAVAADKDPMTKQDQIVIVKGGKLLQHVVSSRTPLKVEQCIIACETKAEVDEVLAAFGDA